MKKSLYIFLSWRILLFLLAIVGILVIPKFGGSFPYANTVLEPTKLPAWIWGFGNFDGVHYLRIAQNGYADAYYQAFFPLFPLLIRFLNFFPKTFGLNPQIFVDPSYFYTGIALANIFLFLSLLVIRKIVAKKEFIWNILLLLSFPTAFYFGAIYTESLFLLELVLFILFFKKKKYLYAAVVASFASATRLVGVLLSLVLLIELIKSVNFSKIKSDVRTLFRWMLPIFISPLGFIAYMWYLKTYFGSPFAFISVQSGFGAGRSSLPIVTLPQVFYRYLKMFFTVQNSYQLFNLSLEFIFALAGLGILIWMFRKVNFSWWIFSALVYILPTLTGTFSSMPRYLIFSYIPFIPAIMKLDASFRKYLVISMVLVQIILLILFARGYWVA